MNVAQISAFLIRNPVTAKVVVGGDFSGRQVLVVVLVNVQNCLPAFRLLDPVAIAVVDEIRTGVPAFPYSDA